MPRNLEIEELKTPEWPPWWDWELELSPHLLKRMVDRGFSEGDLREMLERATALRPDTEPGRWVAEARLARRKWEVVIEPDQVSRRQVIVTAYPVTKGTR